MQPLSALAAHIPGIPPVVWLGLLVLCLIVIGVGKLFSAATKSPPPPQPGQPFPPPGQPFPPPQQQSQPFAPPQTPFCQTCGGPGRWLVESNAWGCDRCRQLIGPPPSAPR